MGLTKRKYASINSILLDCINELNTGGKRLHSFGDESLYLPITIGDLKVMALVDTGATINTISPNIIKAFNIPVRPSYCCIRGIGGVIKSGGTVKVKADICQDKFIIEAEVVNTEMNVILGMPFLRLYGVEISPTRNELSILVFDARLFDNLSAIFHGIHDQPVRKVFHCISGKNPHGVAKPVSIDVPAIEEPAKDNGEENLKGDEKNLRFKNMNPEDDLNSDTDSKSEEIPSAEPMGAMGGAVSEVYMMNSAGKESEMDVEVENNENSVENNVDCVDIGGSSGRTPADNNVDCVDIKDSSGRNFIDDMKSAGKENPMEIQSEEMRNVDMQGVDMEGSSGRTSINSNVEEDNRSENSIDISDIDIIDISHR